MFNDNVFYTSERVGDVMKVKEQQIREAVARGWCYTGNAHKEMDVMLAEAITQEVVSVIEDTEEYDTDNVEEHGCIERVLPEEPKELKSCVNCKYYDEIVNCYSIVGGCNNRDKFEPKLADEKPKVEKVKKYKLKMKPNTLAYFQKIICKDCPMDIKDCGWDCNLDRYIVKVKGEV
jgi:hypothetical protein